jgi:hypothetical protein
MSNQEDEINVDEVFGKTSINRKVGDGYKIWKLQMPDHRKNEESTTFDCRLIPSMKSYRATGQWAFYYGNHFGYCGNNSRNPEKPRARPFGCIQEMENKVVVKHCPKCDQIAQIKDKLERHRHNLKESNPTLDDGALKALYRDDKTCRAFGDWLQKHNCSRKVWINVMTPTNEFGVLQLSYTTYKKLVLKLNKWESDEGIDAFNPAGGVWIRFTRTGKTFNDVEDDVEYVTNVVEFNGKKMKEPKQAPMSKEQIAQAFKVCPDLAKDVVKFLPADKIQALVDSKGDLDKVDEIWDGPKKQEAAATTETESVDVDDLIETAAPTPAPVPVEAPKAVEKKASPAPKAAKPAPVATPAAAMVIDDIDAFVSQFGVDK